MSYDDFENKVQEIREENKVILEDFKKWLLMSGLKEKTVKKHALNVDFYINDFLLYDDCVHAKDGIILLNGFFNWFFPRKAMWSSKASTKETAAGLKKFYKYLAEAGIVEDEDYQCLLSDIKNEMPEWLENYSEEYEW